MFGCETTEAWPAAQCRQVLSVTLFSEKCQTWTWTKSLEGRLCLVPAVKLTQIWGRTTGFIKAPCSPVTYRPGSGRVHVTKRSKGVWDQVTLKTTACTCIYVYVYVWNMWIYCIFVCRLHSSLLQSFLFFFFFWFSDDHVKGHNNYCCYYYHHY